MKTYRFSVEVNCPISNQGGILKKYEDHGFIILPDSYSDSGKPTRLVISCHGAGGAVTADDSQAEHQELTQYLVANGYAVMDVNGLPYLFAEENEIDVKNNIGSPIAVDCYVKAYEYCVKSFNIFPEVFVHGASMGGISSVNLVLSGLIPVIAQSAYCPVLDTYNEIFLHPWSGGLPKEALGKIYRFDKDASGEYIYDEGKIRAFNPATNKKAISYPVPLKFWHCKDDDVVCYNITRRFIDRIKRNGGEAYLRTFSRGKHSPNLAGKPVKHPSGNTLFGETRLNPLPAAEETLMWIRSFDIK